MVKRWIGLIALSLVLFVLSLPAASAHGNNSLAYSDISFDKGVIQYKLQIDMYDLRAAAKPNDSDQEFTTPEAGNQFVKSSQAEVEAYMLSQINLYADNLPLKGKLTQLQYLEKEKQPFAEALLEYPIGHIPEHFVLNYNLVFDNDQWHINYVTIALGDMKQEAVIVNDLREVQMGHMSFQHAVKQFFLLGLKYPLNTYIPLLFVLGLLIVLKSVKQILAVVGSFAVAHSVTLILASLHIMTLPDKFVESVIALSVVYVALNSLFNHNKKSYIWLAILFGLIHGFGFAQALSGIRMDGGQFASSLAAFNVGIEVSLILIVLILYPVFHYLRKLKWGIPAFLTILSLFGLIGFIEKAYL